MLPTVKVGNLPQKKKVCPKLARVQDQTWYKTSVADPDPDPVGSGFFGRIRIRIRVLGPGSGSDLTEISIFFLSSIIAKAGIILFKQC